MQTLSLHRQFSCSIAKQAGTMPAVWFANSNGLSYDRTPEGITPGFFGGLCS